MKRLIILCAILLIALPCLAQKSPNGAPVRLANATLFLRGTDHSLQTDGAFWTDTLSITGPLFTEGIYIPEGHPCVEGVAIVAATDSFRIIALTSNTQYTRNPDTSVMKRCDSITIITSGFYSWRPNLHNKYGTYTTFEYYKMGSTSTSKSWKNSIGIQ